MKILIAEDDFTCRMLLQELLKGYGTTHVAANGREALAAAGASIESGEPYDLVCMDIMMPEMDGQQAVAEIRAMEVAAGVAPGKGTKIVMTTALGDMKHIMNAYGNLCDGYLVKPIRKDALAGELRKLKLVE